MICRVLSCVAFGAAIGVAWVGWLPLAAAFLAAGTVLGGLSDG